MDLSASNVASRIIQWSAVLLFVTVSSRWSQGQEEGPSYKVEQACSSDTDCPLVYGETCWNQYQGCSKGRCTCNPFGQFRDKGGRCLNRRLGLEECRSSKECTVTMSCLRGRCECTYGRMTDDRMFCLRSNEKLLGQHCRTATDVCFQIGGQFSEREYTKNDVICSMQGYCTCADGYKASGTSCNRLQIGDHGCHQSHHCKEGAVCISNTCQCPSGYRAVYRNSRCIRKGAEYDRPLDAPCSEIEQKSYCAKNLLCLQCTGESSSRCVKYLEQDRWSHISSAAGTVVRPSRLRVVVVVGSLFVNFLLRKSLFVA